ncbi:hypothetical protein Tco_1532532 [Tanacetum coccineum]
MEAQYGKFLDMIRAVRINVPLVDVLAGMPNYGKFLKELVSNNLMRIDVIDEILEGDFDALLDESSEILHSIEGTILKEKLFAEFDEFMAMTADDNSELESNTEPFEKITFNTDYKIKPLPDNLEYAFLEEPSFLPVIISSQLSEQNKNKLVSVLKRHKQAFAWKTTDILRICLCILAIFHDMIEESVEVFMNDFSVFRNSFDNCLNNLDKMLQRCKDAHLILNWEKCHFMVKEGIMLGHKVSEAGLEVDKAKIDIIYKLPSLLISKEARYSAMPYPLDTALTRI